MKKKVIKDDIEDDIKDFDFDYKRKNFNEHGIDVNGLDKDGYNINGINKYGVNKDGLNMMASGKGLNISSLPVLLSKIYTNNSSKELINEIKKLVKNLYKNKQITKQVYNILNKALINNDS